MLASKPMRNFFIKVVVFVIGTSLSFNVLGSLADRVAPLDDWRGEQQQRIAILESKRDQIEAITLGNSHSDAIDYSVIGMDGQSLAFQAADLFEVEKYAAYLDDKLPNLKTVFIAISYYSFSRDNATFEPFRTRRLQFYSLIPVQMPVSGDARNFLFGKLDSSTHVMSVVRSDNWKGVWTTMLDDSASVDPFSYDGVTTQSAWGTCAHYTTEQLETHARDIAGRNVTSSNQMAAIHSGLTQDATAALARTIEALEAKGIRVILFTPTYYEKYNEYFLQQGSTIVQEMMSSVQELRQTYQAEYYDLSRDTEIQNQPELFYNSDHLGDCGKKVFSAKLLQAMNGNPE